MAVNIDWHIAHFTEIAKLKKGTEPGRQSYCAPSEGIRFLRVGDISGKAEESVNTKSDKVVICKPDDILVSFDGTPGIVARGLYGAISSGIRIIIPDKSVIDSSYLYHYLQTKMVQRIIRKYTSNQNIAHASRSIPYIEIIYPSDIRMQEKYGMILDKIQNIIRKRRLVVQLLSNWIQSLLVDKFGDPVINPKALPTSKINDIVAPEKHSIKSGPFGSHLLQHELRIEGTIRVLYPEDISEDKISNRSPKFISEEKYEKLKTFTVNSGNVLISLMGTLGRVAVVPDSFPKSIISKHLMLISVDPEKYNPEFLRYVLQNPTMIKQVRYFALGQTQKGLNTSMVKKIIIPVPKLSVQEEFVLVARRIDRYLELARILYNRCGDLYQAVVDKLILNNIMNNNTVKQVLKP